jgi:mannose-6-phosphate isomerase-like protein (cupin superfamily)
MGNSSSLDASVGAVVIRPDEVPLEKGEKHRLTLRRLVRRDRHGPGLSVTWIALRGVHTRSLCRESERVYYILSGSADFVLGDAPPEHVTAGDAVFIPRGACYSLKGDVDYLVMNGPAFRPGSDEYLE